MACPSHFNRRIEEVEQHCQDVLVEVNRNHPTVQLATAALDFRAACDRIAFDLNPLHPEIES